MDLDVLFPFHRVDKFLEAAINSIAQSKDLSLNVIAIDDRPNQTQDISSYFKGLKNYSIISTGGGKGYGKALEIGSTMLTAPHTALFNSDDLMDPMRLRLQIEKLSDYELSITSLKRISARGKSSSSLTGNLKSGKYDPIFLLLGSYGANASWCMRTGWWLENSFFDDLESLDWRIALSSFSKTNISFLDSPLYFYRKHKLQVTADKTINQNRMSPVYDKWTILADSYLLTNSSRQIFDVFATPWLLGEASHPDNLVQWATQILEHGNRFETAIQKDLKNLINRRFLLASRNKNNSIVSRLTFARLGYSELFPIMKDIIS